MLYAHGHCDDPQSIVLDHSSYRRAYHDTPYRRLFENLWSQQHLVFVGFGFSDVTLEIIADEVLWQTARQDMQKPRHLAIVGLPEDQEYSPSMRREFQDRFNTTPIFYPVLTASDGQPDHTGLLTVLQSLPHAAGPLTPEAPPGPRNTALAVGVSVPAEFIHELQTTRSSPGERTP